MKLYTLIATSTVALALAGSFGVASAADTDRASRWAPNGNSLHVDPRMIDPGNPLEYWPVYVPPVAVAPTIQIQERIVERIVEVEKIVIQREPTGAVAYEPRPARADRN